MNKKYILICGGVAIAFGGLLTLPSLLNNPQTQVEDV